MGMGIGKRVLWLATAVGCALFGLLSLQGAAQGAPTTGNIIITEVAWGGTAASTADEWIELHNPTAAPINIAGWSLSDGGDINITFAGSIPAGGFYLLERTDNTTVSDIPADTIYTGGLANTGETLTLRDAANQIIDTAHVAGGAWPAGSSSPNFFSMERSGPDAADIPANWHNNDGLTRNGLDAGGNPLNGTPRQPNSGWVVIPPGPTADLSVAKTAPLTATPGSLITYHISLSNSGELPATAVLLTDTLPMGLTYIGDDSGWPLTPSANLLTWQVGDVPTATLHQFILTATIGYDAAELTTNLIQATSPTTESTPFDNSASASTQIIYPNTAVILVDALLYMGQDKGTSQGDEAVRLRNVGATPADLSGWTLSDGTSTAVIPAGITLPSGGTLWLAKDAAAFTRQFGYPPALEDANTDPAVPDLLGTWPGYADAGDEVFLRDDNSALVDVLVYGTGNTAQLGWQGTAVTAYSVGGNAAERGQILYRKLSQTSALSVADTNTAADWAQDPTDWVDGRKVLYPGWQLESFFFTPQFTETAVITLAIAPDNAYDVLVQEIAAAQTSLHIESHTFEHWGIAQALIAASQRGVSVTVLLEGGPPGGLTDQQRYICQELEAAGGQCWTMVNDDPSDIYDRYTYLHAKFMLIDSQRVLISSENLSPNSLPNDDKSDGTFGRRGLLLVTDAPTAVAHVAAIWAADFAPATQHDLHRYDPDFDGPPPTYVPITQTGGTTYTVRYPAPLAVTATFPMELIQAPENALRTADGLLGLLARAGAGDTLLIQQLTERPFWADAPNPRLAAYIAAARRGAAVWLLLDSYFDTPNDPLSNHATCELLRQIALDEHLDLHCQTGNPTGLGIHNKMVLAQINGRGTVHLGSLNGTENSHKLNRELAIQVESDALYTVLAEMFGRDWRYQIQLPVVFNNFTGPATHPLISELLYDPTGPDNGEFIELVNPVGHPLDLSGWSLSDASLPTDFADLRRFPAGTLLVGGETIVVAQQATAFAEKYGFPPTFEILETDAAVPNLVDDLAWGDPATFLQFGNLGDIIYLRDTQDQAIDVIFYGNKSYPTGASCTAVASGHSLRRRPYWRDTDDCARDFEDWPSPDPGLLP